MVASNPAVWLELRAIHPKPREHSMLTLAMIRSKLVPKMPAKVEMGILVIARVMWKRVERTVTYGTIATEIEIALELGLELAMVHLCSCHESRDLKSWDVPV